MTAQASGLNSNVLSFKVVARIPRPRRTPRPRRARARAAAIPASTTVRVQHNAVQAHQVHTSSTSNGHIVDQAVHALVQNPLLFKNKKGH